MIFNDDIDKEKLIGYSVKNVDRYFLDSELDLYALKADLSPNTILVSLRFINFQFSYFCFVHKHPV